MVVAEPPVEPRVRKHPQANCEACPLYDGDFVPSKIPDSVRMAVVAEAPGWNETIEGEPLVGKTGKIMRRSLFQIIEPDDVALMNACSCRPEGNATPSDKAILACRPRLLADIAEAKDRGARLVLTAGAVGLKSLTNDLKRGILKERGRLVRSDDAEIDVFPTVHPSYVNHEPSAWNDFKSDLEGAVEYLELLEAGGTKEEHVLPQVIVAVDEVEALRFVDEMAHLYSALSFDIETDSVKNRIRFKKDRIIAVSFSWDGEHAYVIPGEFLTPRVTRQIVWLLRNVTVVTQNGKFDTKFINAQWIGVDDCEHWIENGADTMLMHHVLDERGGEEGGKHDLKYMATQYLGAPDYEAEIREWLLKENRRRSGEANKENRRRRKLWLNEGVPFEKATWERATYGAIPPDMLHKYGGYDAAYTYRLATKLRSMVRDQGLDDIYTLELRASNAFNRIETRGILVDPDLRSTLRRELRQELTRLEGELKAATWPEFKINAPAQLAKALFDPEYLGFPIPAVARRRPKGSQSPQKHPSTNKDVLKLFKGHPFVDNVTEYRILAKLLRSYVDSVDVCDCGRLHPDFRIHASVTGRLSEPIMTVPKPKVGRPNLRDLVIAPPGYVLLEADYKAGELMVVAALSGDEKMREAIFAGVDLHDALMRDLGMLTKEQYVEKLGPDDGVKEYETQRRSAKVINFGVIYGMEANLLSIILGIEEWEAELFLERYWEVRQGVRRWMDDVHKQAWTTGVLETPFGRRRRYGLVSDETRKKIGREAGNLFPQSILTDCMLESTVEFMDVTTVRDNHVILFYHDSITAEVPETEDVVGVAAGLRAIMQDVPKRRLKTDIPFDADFKVGTRWGSLKALKID